MHEKTDRIYRFLDRSRNVVHAFPGAPLFDRFDYYCAFAADWV